MHCPVAKRVEASRAPSHFPSSQPADYRPHCLFLSFFLIFFSLCIENNKEDSQEPRSEQTPGARCSRGAERTSTGSVLTGCPPQLPATRCLWDAWPGSLPCPFPWGCFLVLRAELAAGRCVIPGGRGGPRVPLVPSAGRMLGMEKRECNCPWLLNKASLRPAMCVQGGDGMR